ncbi:VOC family protein [Streptomyces sp. WZ-12]|uniref:VOC family protein n=1 Tax=Streptomyces sp. WZ-12 TaxID=3030210 RepID=UPI0023817F1E|nr:VOC family protein [Streptomyces sp. WZ-12]
MQDLDASCLLYRKLGFKQIPNTTYPGIRYLTFGHTWLILSGMFDHGNHNAVREQAARTGPLGNGFVLTVPTKNLHTIHNLWRVERLPVTLEPADAPWGRIFMGLDPDGYELLFEQIRNN